MSISQLSTNSFIIQQSAKGPAYCSRIHGMSITFFYSTKCPHCKRFMPVFQSLAQHVRGLQFTVLDIGRNKGVLQHSKATITPITHVPFIVIYINGVPFEIYNGPNTFEHLYRYLTQLVNHVTTRQQHRAPKKKRQTTELDRELRTIRSLHNGMPYNIIDEDYSEILRAYTQPGKTDFSTVDRRNSQMGRSAFTGY